MKIILLSGGSGKRLWPLSNEVRAKQFLKVLLDDQGNVESMMQRVWRQLKTAGLAEEALIAVGQAQVDMINKQLGTDLKMMVEPERRDTFAAIALAVVYLHSVEKVSSAEIVTILPIDAFVQNDFFAKIRETETVLRETGAELVLLGVEPVFPSEKYGYIVPGMGGGQGNYQYVERFKEKPGRAEAQQLIEHGALWNCGIFSFKLEFLLAKLKESGFATDYAELLANYCRLPKQSFDYVIAEKANARVVLPYHGQWKDLGTWNTLTEEMPKAIWGNGIISKDCRNTHLINELDTPVIVQGLNDAVVAVTPDGILVSSKESSPQVKELVDQVRQRPMYEERHWGWYKVLEHVFYSEPEKCEVLIKRLKIEAGKNLSYQRHSLRDETWIFVQGEGEVALNGIISKVEPGLVIKVPKGAAHSIRAVTDLEIVETQIGRLLVEEDIERFLLDWPSIQMACTK